MLRFFLSLAVFVSFSALHANAIPASRSLAPSCDQYLSILRSKNCSIRDFRKATQKLGLALASKLAGEQAMRSVRVETPLTETSGAVPAKPVMLVPVLRAGLSLLPPFLEFFEDASVGFVGVRRNEETLKPEPYYKNIPEASADTEVLLLDPMLATGGSMEYSIRLLQEKGIKTEQIHAMAVIAAPEGIKHLRETFPDLRITAAVIDDHLNEIGYIVPGLGDYGDRYFGTE